MKDVGASLRVLILTLNLLNTDLGLTAEQLLSVVPGYLPAERDSAMRKLERDIAALRSAGLNVVVDQANLARDEKPRYRVPRRGNQTGDLRLSKEEFTVLSKAANAWDDSASTRAAVVLNKLRAKSEIGVENQITSPQLGLDGAPYLSVLHEGIANRQPVSFDYQSRHGRDVREVAPWNMIARGSALYLWGFDLNRWAPRLFRLSRFRSVPQLIAEPGSVAPVGALANEEFSTKLFTVAPILAVKRGGAPLVRLRSGGCGFEENAENESGVTQEDILESQLPEGWEILVGVEDDIAAWEAAVLREADEVVVLGPKHFSEFIRKRLAISSTWVGNDHG